MKRQRQPHIDNERVDIDDGIRELPPHQIKPHQNGTGYVWHGGTCELIEILPEGHPQYRQNREQLLEAFRRWDRGGKR